MSTRIEKLMRFANDPSATAEERAAYKAKADELRGKPEADVSVDEEAGDIVMWEGDLARSTRRPQSTRHSDYSYGTCSTFSSYAVPSMVTAVMTTQTESGMVTA